MVRQHYRIILYLLLIENCRKKAEIPDLSQMVLAVVQSNLELAKSAPGAMPQYRPTGGQSTELELARRTSQPDSPHPYTIDLPVDMSAMNLHNEGKQSEMVDDGEPYIFVPSDPRACYRAVLKEALTHDFAERHDSVNGAESDSIHLLSKRSAELLNEIGHRWRVQYITRMLLFLDVAREKFMDQEIDLDTLDAAFTYAREPPADKKKPDMSAVFDHTRWTMADYTLSQQTLKLLDDTLLRDLYEQLLHCYEAKPPEIGPVMTVLETHIYSDPLFSRSSDDLDRFSDALANSLREKARDHYHWLFENEIGQSRNQLEFYHVIQFGKAVVKFLERIQKRYRRTPQIMGYSNLLKVNNIVNANQDIVLSHFRYWQKPCCLRLQQMLGSRFLR